MNPKPPNPARRPARERRTRWRRAARQERRIGQVEDAGNAERRVTIARLARVPPPDQGDILRTHHRASPASLARGESPCPTASARHMLATDPVCDCSGVAKSAWASIYASPISPARRPAPSKHPRTMLQSPPRTITNRPLSRPSSTPIREQPAVRLRAVFVPGTAGRTREVPIGRGHHVAEIGGVEPRHQAEFSKDPGARSTCRASPLWSSGRMPMLDGAPMTATGRRITPHPARKPEVETCGSPSQWRWRERSASSRVRSAASGVTREPPPRPRAYDAAPDRRGPGRSPGGGADPARGRSVVRRSRRRARRSSWV